MIEPNRDFLEAALVGLEFQRVKLNGAIAAIRARLNPNPESPDPAVEPRRRHMTARGRASIARAMRARWREYHRLKRLGLIGG